MFLKLPLDASFVVGLNYKNFFSDPFPKLHESWHVEMPSGRFGYRTFKESQNRPILHRKELLLHPDHPDQLEFQKITEEAENIGLFADPSKIGYESQWDSLVEESGYVLESNHFIPIGNELSDEIEQKEKEIYGVQRHLTAISRNNFSAPVKALMRFGYLNGEYTFFDYGCGKQDDLNGLKENNIIASGWDPFTYQMKVKIKQI